jgi:hypothetical protein
VFGFGLFDAAPTDTAEIWGTCVAGFTAPEIRYVICAVRLEPVHVNVTVDPSEPSAQR